MNENIPPDSLRPLALISARSFRLRPGSCRFRQRRKTTDEQTATSNARWSPPVKYRPKLASSINAPFPSCPAGGSRPHGSAGQTNDEAATVSTVPSIVSLTRHTALYNPHPHAVLESFNKCLGTRTFIVFSYVAAKFLQLPLRSMPVLRPNSRSLML